jgi:arylsulfatase A-like enzyme/imidazolonepropionase-like amidohydrolase
MVWLNIGPISLAASQNHPNILIFLADDQGWGDLSVNGNTNLSTPHIDSLARDGVTLNHFYVCAVCAPTRAEFLTGRYHPRTGVSGVSRGEERLNPEETTLADVFKRAGYATGAFGKWHNGTQSPYHPNDRGFDEFYGFTSGHWGHYFSPPLEHNGKKVRGKGYVTDDFTDHALDFITANQDRPFVCYIPYNTPHSPMMIDDAFYDQFAELDPGMRHRDPNKEDVMMTRAALAMCENIDWNVGRVLQRLDDLQLSENTIVIYFSDNGPNSWRWNGGMKGKKGAVDEGGVRSPFFLRWPGKIAGGRVVEQVSGAIDLLPTLAQLAGIPLETRFPLDGRSVADLLVEKRTHLRPRLLFSEWQKKASVRSGRFRLDQTGQLFDIENDRGQTVDVSVDYPETKHQLAEALKAHIAEMSQAFESFKDRPFTVGFGPRTVLPARDGVEHGTIQRSAKAPNHSFFENWTHEEDSITWDVDVVGQGIYKAVVFYTCAEKNVGTKVRLSMEGHQAFVEAAVSELFDPPLYDKSTERVEISHYFVKDFQPLSLGMFHLKEGRGVLRLTAPQIVGGEAIDVHSIELHRVASEINPPLSPSDEQITAIVGGRLIDGFGGEPVGNATILIRGDTILDAGSADKVSVPAGARRVDATGKSVMPGLIDSHFHSMYNIDTPVTYELHHGITSFRDPGHPFKYYQPVMDFDGMLPRVFLCGAHLDGPPPVWPDQAVVVRDIQHARETVREHVRQGASAIKVYFRLPLEHVKAVCEEAGNQGVLVTAHLELVDADAAIRAGVRGIEHVTSFGTALADPEHVKHFKDSVQEDSNARRRLRHWLWSTLDLERSGRVESLIQLLVEKDVVVSPTLAIFEARQGENDGTEEKEKAFKNMKCFVSMCHQAGVRIVVGSHTTAPFAEKGRAYQRELEILKECGLSPMELIQAATHHNAEFFNIQDRLGTIEKGKLADLILIDGDPSKDMGDLNKLSGVMLNGIWVDMPSY